MLGALGRGIKKLVSKDPLARGIGKMVGKSPILSKSPLLGQMNPAMQQSPMGLGKRAAMMNQSPMGGGILHPPTGLAPSIPPMNPPMQDLPVAPYNPDMASGEGMMQPMQQSQPMQPMPMMGANPQQRQLPLLSRLAAQRRPIGPRM